MTAAHCPNGLNYENRLNAEFMGEAKGVNTDAQWHRSPQEDASNNFIYSRNERTGQLSTNRVTSVDTATPGTGVCFYGDYSNGACTSVIAIGEDARDSRTQELYYGITIANTYISTGGDSGGPWFTNQKAYGIHWGRIRVDGRDRSAYTSLQRIYATTDLRVLTL